MLGYQIVRQSGSHIRLMTTQNGVHHLTIPHHSPLKVGTLLGGILKPAAAHHKLTVEALLSHPRLVMRWHTIALARGSFARRAVVDRIQGA